MVCQKPKRIKVQIAEQAILKIDELKIDDSLNNMDKKLVKKATKEDVKPPKKGRQSQLKPMKTAPQCFDANQLGLYKSALPHSIVEIIATLNRAGFLAYIVGGGVRDSLLGLAPKDFDAVTNARPHEIKEVFGSRCRIIGKRFQLAHVYSGREMIEVATFRSAPVGNQHTNHGGMIMRDNVWGNINDDFVRRDFSINALYFDPIKSQVKDFCGALHDIQSKTLRLLGKPALRIEEDPVRLLRALRFKAKLGFEFDEALAKQFCPKNWQLLGQVSAHRLYDETQKMFTGGYLQALLPLLYQYGATKALFFCADGAVPNALMMAVAKSSDERVADGRAVNPAYFYAALLWDDYLHHLDKFKKKFSFYDAQMKAARRTIERQRVRTAIPRFAEEFITQIWLLQPKLTKPCAQDVNALISHPRFRAAYDFLLMREMADDNPKAELTNGMGVWWTQFILFDDKARQKMVDELSGLSKNKRYQKTDVDKQSSAELWQIQQLSLNDGKQAKAVKPLFEMPQNSRQKRRRVPTPVVLQAVCYSDDDFAKLLMDEPFTPARRKHKTKPMKHLLDDMTQGEK